MSEKSAALHPIRKMKRPISHLLALSPFYDASLFSSHDIMGCSGYGFLLPQNPSVFMVTHAALIYNITAQKRGMYTNIQRPESKYFIDFWALFSRVVI